MGKGGGHITNGIRALRFHQGEMTQQELADRVGVTRQTINVIGVDQRAFRHAQAQPGCLEFAEPQGLPIK